MVESFSKSTYTLLRTFDVTKRVNNDLSYHLIVVIMLIYTKLIITKKKKLNMKTNIANRFLLDSKLLSFYFIT